MAWGSVFMTNQQKLIGAILVAYLSLCTTTYAIEPLQKGTRLNMGY
jgi:hypothetical protein